MGNSILQPDFNIATLLILNRQIESGYLKQTLLAKPMVSTLLIPLQNTVEKVFKDICFEFFIAP